MTTHFAETCYETSYFFLTLLFRMPNIVSKLTTAAKCHDYPIYFVMHTPCELHPATNKENYRMKSMHCTTGIKGKSERVEKKQQTHWTH